ALPCTDGFLRDGQHRIRPPRHNAEARFLDQPAKRPRREVVQMLRNSEAGPMLAEHPRLERTEVRHREIERAVRSEQASNVPERRSWRWNVLQYLVHDHEAEVRRLQRCLFKRRRIDCRFRCTLCLPGGAAGRLDAIELRVAEVLQLQQALAVSTTDVEDR